MLTENGWTAITSGDDSRLVPLSWITGKVLGGPVHIVFDYLCGRFNAEVEPIVREVSWGWDYRRIENSTSLSNHASGTAVDLNPWKHPYGGQLGFDAAQVRVIRDIQAACGNVIRWGGDYTGKLDGMHFEIHPGAGIAEVSAVAARLSGTQTEENEDMAILILSGRGYALLDGGNVLPIGDMATVNSYKMIGVKQAIIADADWDRAVAASTSTFLLVNDARGFGIWSGGKGVGIGDMATVQAFRNKGVPEISISAADFDRFMA